MDSPGSVFTPSRCRGEPQGWESACVELLSLPFEPLLSTMSNEDGSTYFLAWWPARVAPSNTRALSTG